MIRALLLDLDGTLVDTDRHHVEATWRALAELGIAIDWATYRAVVHGGANEDIVARLLPGRASADGRRYVVRKEALFRELLAETVVPVAGAPEMVRAARRRGLGLAVVSNAPRENADLLLRPFGGAAAFEAVVLAEDLPAGKPDPLPYRTALARLGVTADEAVGFEDSPPGLRALVGAGVFPVGVATAGGEEALRAAGARAVLRDFSDPRLASLVPPLAGRPVEG